MVTKDMVMRDMVMKDMVMAVAMHRDIADVDTPEVGTLDMDAAAVAVLH